MNSGTIGSLRSAFDRSFQLKLFILCGFFMLLAGCVVTLYAVSVVQSAAIESLGSSTSDYAAGIANRIMDELDSSLEISRTVAKTFEGVKFYNIPLSRQDAIHMLIPVFSSSPYLHGGGIVWEPNAFDGRDFVYEKSMYHDETGRFVPYFHKTQSGDIYVQPATGYTTDVWYLGPRETRTSVITEPFFINTGEKEELMTTISSPIIVDETFLGVAMVDMKLERLQDHADAVKKRRGEGQMLIISNSGLIAAATGRPELRNQPMEEFHSFLSNDIINIDYGTSGYRVRNGYIEVYAPIYVSWTKTPWLVEVFYPTDVIMKEVRPVVIRLGIMGLVATILGVMCIWYGVRRLALPLQMTAIGLKELTLGRTTRKIEPKGNDEIAEIARSFDRTLDHIKKDNYLPNSNFQSITENREKIQEIQRKVIELKKYAKNIEQTATTLLTSVQSISNQTSSLPETPFYPSNTYNDDASGWRKQDETGHDTRTFQAANEIETEVYELQQILLAMKNNYKSENLPSGIISGFADLEERFFVILRIVKIIRKTEQKSNFDYI
jgi:methyl-accepting chemotaxis protein